MAQMANVSTHGPIHLPRLNVVDLEERRISPLFFTGKAMEDFQEIGQGDRGRFLLGPLSGNLVVTSHPPIFNDHRADFTERTSPNEATIEVEIMEEMSGGAMIQCDNVRDLSPNAD